MEKSKPTLRQKLLRKRNIVILALAVLVIVAVATRGFGLLGGKKTEKYTIVRGNVTEELVISGSVTADKFSQMTFSGSGKIEWIGVTEGDSVKKGQAIVKLDTKVLNSAFEDARSDLRAAEANAQYVVDSVKDHSKDETYYQKTTRTTAEAARDSAYEAYKIAEENLRNATLYAPFAGVISFLTEKSAGVNVTYLDKIVEVIDPSTLFFEVLADQTEVTKLKEDMKVELILDSFPDEKIAGTIEYVSLTPQSADSGSTYKVKIKFDTTPDINKVRMGMTGDGRFVTQAKDNVLLAPARYINSDSKGKYVLLGDVKNKVYVETGIEGEDNIEIVSGVAEGDILLD